jgi:hypothetical protein
MEEGFPSRKHQFGGDNNKRQKIVHKSVDSLFSGGDIAPPAPQPIAVPLAEVAPILQKKHNPNCFLCKIRLAEDADPESPQAKIYALVRDNFGRISNRALYERLVEAQYEHYIKPFEDVKDAKGVPKLMTVAECKEHFEAPHGVMLELDARSDFLKLHGIVDYLGDQIAKRRGNDENTEADPKMVAAYVSVLKEKYRVKQLIEEKEKKN